MATKAELEKELAALKQEQEQRRAADVAAALGSGSPPDHHGDETDGDALGLKKVLKDHGIDAQSIESLGGTLLEELKALQKERPLTVVLAAFTLGLVVGRVSK